MKTPEDIILFTIGIRPGAAPSTPMDYQECKMCMKIYAKECLDEAAEVAMLQAEKGLPVWDAVYALKDLVEKQ